MYRFATKYGVIWKGSSEKKDFEGYFNKDMKMRKAFQAEGTHMQGHMILNSLMLEQIKKSLQTYHRNCVHLATMGTELGN